MADIVPLLAPSACLLVGVLIGLRIKHRRFLRERTLRLAEAAKVDAYDRQAFATDLAEIGPVTPPRGTVELFDGARLAEWRGQLNQAERVDFVPEAPDHLGQACGYPRAEVGGPTCDRPAEGWVHWDNGHVEWLCAEHYTLVMGEEVSG